MILNIDICKINTEHDSFLLISNIRFDDYTGETYYEH